MKGIAPEDYAARGWGGISFSCVLPRRIFLSHGGDFSLEG